MDAINYTDEVAVFLDLVLESLESGDIEAAELALRVFRDEIESEPP